MANTFKVKTKLNTGISSGVSTIYTTPSSTTAVLVGLTLANTSSNSITATVTLTNNDGDNVTLLKDAPVPTGSSLEMMSGTNIVMEASDILKAYASAANSLDCTLSLMEIT